MRINTSLDTVVNLDEIDAVIALFTYFEGFAQWAMRDIAS